MDWDNEEFVAEKVQSDSFDLRYASDRLRNNVQIVSLAVKKMVTLYYMHLIN
jgi:hypothetical protein